MEIGVVTLPTDLSAPIGDLAAEVEQRGLASLYLGGDHTHIPAARTTPFPGADELPDEYRRTYDPIVATTQVVSRTSTIRTGPCVFLAAQRDPITTAKQIASVDHLSGGRVDFGVGYGWNVEEAANHGVEWSTRRRRVKEYVAAMKVLWTEDEASFDGEFVSFDRAWMWPKPASSPHPRVLLGASPGPRTFEAIADWCDGWISVPFWGHTPDHVAQLRAVAEERGRDPRELAMVVDGVLPDPAMIDPWFEAEVESVIIPLPSVGLDELLPVLDAAAALVDRYR